MKKKYTYLIVIFLIVASYDAFGRLAGNDFINFDDPGYITENYHVQSGINLQNIKWASSAVVMSNWHPLTWLSHTLDWSLFGANASGHHLVSLLLQIGAVLFLFFFLNKTTNNLWPAAFAAALFALHPLRVESVAWAAERKDVLSMFFGMACLYTYAFYTENYKLSRYFLCLILFALSLMSKPMLVTLPFILLLLDYWPLGRWQKALDEPGKMLNLVRGLIWEKIPFICLTIVSSIVTLWVQNKGGAVSSADILPFVTRVANAIVSYVAYLEKTFWPVNLAVFYPYEFHLSLWKVTISGMILILITLAVLYYIRKLPFLFVGWFWYLGTLIPVIGLVQVGQQTMADRFTYLPSIGIAIMLAWGIPLLFNREDIRRMVLFPAAMALLIILSVLTWQQCGYWKNSITLYNHALQVTKDNVLAHNNLGFALFAEGKIEEAIDNYNKVLRITQGDVQSYTHRGVAYAALGQYQRAIEDFNQVIRLKPDYAFAYNNRGGVYFLQGSIKPGCRDAQKACELGICKALEMAKSRGYCR
jgi:tetratricopeptide (TPR) repeat protein